jgi:ATP-binding cassette subfamily B protein
MPEEKKDRKSGLAAAKEQLPSLFPYLRRYKNGLYFGAFCVLVTAATASVIPLFVSGTLKYLTAEANTFEPRASLILVESLVARTLNLTSLIPWIWEVQGEAVDRLAMTPVRENHHLAWYFTGILGFAIGSGVFRFLQRWILIGISRKIEFDLRNDLFAHLLKMSPTFFDRMTTGDIVARATNDLNQVRSMLGPGVMYPINAGLTMFFAVCGMVYLSPLLTLVALGPPLVMAVGTNRIAKLLHDRFTLVQEQYSKISSKVQENLSGIRVVKAYTREEAEVEAIRDLNRDYLKKNLDYFSAMGVLYPFFSFTHNLGRLVVLGVGGWMMLSPARRFDLGDFAAFFLYLNMLHFPMISIGWVLNVIQRGVASLVRINEVLESVPAIRDPENPISAERIEGELVFQNVTFSYREGRPVLKNISLTVSPGTVLGVIGATGSGKSTLTHLIPRFYDTQEGEILLDGKPVQQYRLADLRKAIGLVSQDHFMFSSTVAKNIGFGIESEDLFERTVEQASQIAAVHDNILEFPKGYETMVGERGITLSGGQRQRAAIARALAIDPKVLILDDALSAVDTHTEEQILRGLRQVMRERTTLLISHRISTVQNADRIIVLERGEIVEEGTHEQLLVLNGIYASIHRQQQLEEEIEEMTA